MSSGTEDIPPDWDALTDRDEENLVTTELPGHGDPEPLALTLMAVAWADLAGMLAVCTACLITLMVLGQRPALAAFTWAAVLSLAWWLCASAVLIVVRQGTPGMLLAGVRFNEPVGTRRVLHVLAAALLGVLTLGLPGLFGSQLSPLRLAAAEDLVADSSD